MDVLSKFLRYVKIDTQSADDSQVIPSTQKQFELSKLLVKELETMGASQVTMDKNAYVYATIPSTNDKNGKVLGFISHIDTAPVVSGKDVNPIVHKNYDGKDIVLPKGEVVSPTEFPQLKNYVGQSIVTSDGSTLLGADDKAGVAEIMTMAQYFLNHPEIKHGTIKIAFTPDEEVGNGATLFDVKGFGADFALTVDGGVLGEIQFENFNAASATVEFFGKSIHPGEAKDKMLNAIEMAGEFCMLLPSNQKPQHTEGYEGFFHLTETAGDVNFAKSHYIVRDHDKNKFEQKKSLLKKLAELMQDKYGKDCIKLTIKDSYFNMVDKILPHMDKIELVSKAFEANGVTPKKIPIRGGTDGARLSFMGLPCPNICTGGHNFHGKKEYIPVESMEKIVDCLVSFALMFGEKY